MTALFNFFYEKYSFNVLFVLNLSHFKKKSIMKENENNNSEKKVWISPDFNVQAVENTEGGPIAASTENPWYHS